VAYLFVGRLIYRVALVALPYLGLDGVGLGGYCLDRTDFIAGLPARKSSENLLPTFLFPGCGENRVRKSV
jgi:hypothetical protein